jgi:hypothetical protein
MGVELALSEGDQKLLAQRIEEIISGEQPLLPYEEDVERLAQTYASQLIRRLSTPKDNHESAEDHELTPEFISINVNSIEKSEPRSVGAENLMLKMSQIPYDEKHLWD